ncbi:hypothetical protein [[Eubacterium] cellulosolvens]
MIDGRAEWRQLLISHNDDHGKVNNPKLYKEINLARAGIAKPGQRR